MGKIGNTFLIPINDKLYYCTILSECIKGLYLVKLEKKFLYENSATRISKVQYLHRSFIDHYSQPIEYE